MKKVIICCLFLIGYQSIFAQEAQTPSFYLGVSFGASFSIGDFKDTDISNPDAGFAKNGNKLDIYGGIPLTEKLTLGGVLRYQRFETEIEDLVETFNSENPGSTFTGTTEDWQTYALLVGIAYQVNITKKFKIYPRFGFGPLIVNNPGLSINSPDGIVTNNFIRSSDTGFGLGYEIGIGLRKNLGKHFALMPTFTFSGGVVTISDVVTTTDNVIVISDYQPTIQSFNIGLSLAYRFYKN